MKFYCVTCSHTFSAPWSKWTRCSYCSSTLIFPSEVQEVAPVLDLKAYKLKKNSKVLELKTKPGTNNKDS